VAADNEDFVILACTVLIQSQSVMDRQTKTDNGAAREKSCAVLNFAHLLVCIVARSRSSRFSLATARSRSRLQV